MPLLYEELIDFIAKGATARDVAEFTPSEAAKERVADLIHRRKTVGISEEEAEELRSFLELEHILRMAKARARERLAG